MSREIETNEEARMENKASKIVAGAFNGLRGWIALALTLIGLIVAGVTTISGLRQEVAVLSERVSLLLSDHEKRIQALEASQKTQDGNLTHLLYLHDPSLKAEDQAAQQKK